MQILNLKFELPICALIQQATEESSFSLGFIFPSTNQVVQKFLTIVNDITSVHFNPIKETTISCFPDRPADHCWYGVADEAEDSRFPRFPPPRPKHRPQDSFWRMESSYNIQRNRL